MNGKQAKRIRREVYGDFSQRGTKYQAKQRTKTIILKGEGKEEKKKSVLTTQLKSTGRRKIYQKAKNELKRMQRGV